MAHQTKIWGGFVVLALALTPGVATSSEAAASSPRAAGFEQAAQQHLPGTWKFEYVNPEPRFELSGTSVYSADGTARYKGTLVVQGQSIPLEFAATWQVAGNKMVTVITESSFPQAVAVGTRSTDTIQELTASVFRYTDDEEGMTLTETKVGL